MKSTRPGETHAAAGRRRVVVPEDSSSAIESDAAAMSEEILNRPLPPPAQRWSTFRTRLMYTLLMIFSFFSIIGAGHAYCSLLVLAIISLSYREIIVLKRKANIEKHLPLFFVQRWYWYLLTLFGCLHMYVLPFTTMFVGRELAPVRWLVANHNLVTYLAVVFGFIVFVLSLKQYSIRYQFAQMAFLLLTCLVVIGQGTAQVRIISVGLIWFFVSTTSVIANDISAYLFGSAYGKHKLLPRISPKKTVEGFLGASVITFLWAMLTTEILAHVHPMTCPLRDYSLVPFKMWTYPRCDTPPEFQLQWLPAPAPISAIPFMPASLPCRPAWGHAFVLAAFASFVAPFGGFLASAFKRALKVKDFGDSIPGHGGVTDRFDCQLLMGMFTYLYLKTFLTSRRSISVMGRLTVLDTQEKWEIAAALISDIQKSLNLDLPQVFRTLQDMLDQGTLIAASAP